jgi:hypothetical protein
MNINNIEYEKILWVFVLFIAYLDLHSTYIGLSSGLVEQNPMGRYIIHTFGFIGLSIFKLFIIGFCYKLSKKLMYGNWIYLTPLILSISWVFATSINIYYIIKVI